MIIRQLAFAAALTGICLGCCDDTFATTHQLQFTNNTSVPVVITDFTKDDTVSQMPGHSMQVGPAQTVSWSVDFPDPSGPAESSTEYLPHGLYQLDVHIRGKIACEWLYTFEQDAPLHSYSNDIYNVMMPGYNFRHQDPNGLDHYQFPAELVLIEDPDSINFINTVLRNDY